MQHVSAQPPNVLDVRPDVPPRVAHAHRPFDTAFAHDANHGIGERVNFGAGTTTALLDSLYAQADLLNCDLVLKLRDFSLQN